VDNCKGEVVCLFTTRYDRPNNTIYITDILVPPQIVTGAFVETDDEHYGLWLNKLPTTTINNLRCEAHSHVDMPASPSGQDESNWPKILTNVKDYYVFLIVNKKGSMYARVYDIECNLIYEPKDITIKKIEPIIDKGYLDRELKANVKESKHGFNKSSSNTRKDEEDPDAYYRDWCSRESRGQLIGKIRV
jgi:hypothetical protein